MWLLKTKDKEGRERKIVGNGYNAREDLFMKGYSEVHYDDENGC